MGDERGARADPDGRALRYPLARARRAHLAGRRRGAATGFFLVRDRRGRAGDDGPIDWDAAYRTYCAVYGELPDPLMPYPAWVIRSEAAALRQLMTAQALGLGLGTQESTAIPRARLCDAAGIPYA